MNRRNAGGLAMAALAALLLSVMPTLIAQSQDKAEAALKAAMDKEVVDGNLKAAIEQYKKLAQGANKPVAARALVRLGECYEKQGNTDARKTYEQVLSKFGDQTEAVAQARARLAALGGGQAGRQTTTLVWKDKKVASESAVSPDGRYIAYADWSTGNLGLHDLVSGANRALTATGSWKKGEAAFAESSAFSRDGRQVAYAWYEAKTNRFELRVASVAGGAQPRPLFSSPEMRWLAPKDWSPDGKWIAVSLEPEDSDARTNQPVQPGMKAALGLVDSQDGSLRVLRTTEWHGVDAGGFGNILLSPDGRYVAYDRPDLATGRRRAVFVAAIGENREMPVAAGSTQEELAGWSPDGKYLLFTSGPTGSQGLWAFPFANGAPQGKPEQIKADVGRIYPIGMSGAGALYYGVFAARVLPRIQVATVDFGTSKFLSPPVDITEAGPSEFHRSPDWSPDGQSLAYISGSTAGAFSIRIRFVRTGTIRELRPKLVGSLTGLRWAPDGRSFAVGAGGLIHRVDAETGETSLLPKTEPGQQFSWSPDGRSLYFRSQDSSKDVAFVRRDLASGTDKEVIRRPFLGGLNLSPDGRYLATMLEPLPDIRTLLLIPVDGSEPRELMKLDRKGYTLQMMGCWAPDSRSLFARVYVRDDKPGEEEIWQVPIDGGEPRQLDLRLDKSVYGFAMHPDGRQIAFVGGQQYAAGQARAGEVWVLENFLPTAKGAPAAK